MGKGLDCIICDKRLKDLSSSTLMKRWLKGQVIKWQPTCLTHWNRLQFLDAPSLEVFKDRLGEALSSLG